MGENTKIEWAHHTFNPWRGCSKVSEGCKHCYAERQSHRNPGTLGVWGPSGTRVVASESMWAKPLQWDLDAAAEGVRKRVFCASLADVFEEWQGVPTFSNGNRLCWIGDSWSNSFRDVAHVPAGVTFRVGDLDDVRNRLFELMYDTPHLDWLLLTKRAESMRDWMGTEYDGADRITPEILRKNVWCGVSVENQAAAVERIPELLKTPAVVRFLSCEPLLDRLDLTPWLETGEIHWVIVGGESGPQSRPMERDWVVFLRDQCEAAGVAFFFKQWGDLMSHQNDDMPCETFRQIDAQVNLAGWCGETWWRVGKKAAGRMLDERTWDEIPEVVR